MQKNDGYNISTELLHAELVSIFYYVKVRACAKTRFRQGQWVYGIFFQRKLVLLEHYRLPLGSLGYSSQQVGLIAGWGTRQRCCALAQFA